MSNDKVVFLEFRKKDTTSEEGGPTVITCKICKNKTWVLMSEDLESFPHVKCACCGQLAGRMGWARDE